MMKKLLFIVYVMFLCMLVSYAQNVKTKSDKITEQTSDNNQKVQKAYEKMQKAKAKFIQEVQNYKNECMESKKRAVEEYSDYIVFNGNDLSNIFDNINYDEIEKKVSRALNKTMESTKCIEEEEQTKIYNLKDFSAIQCDGIAQIIFTQNKKYSVKAVCGKSLINYLDIKVKNGTLFIDIIKNSQVKLNKYRKIKIEIYVSAPNLKSLNLGGISTFTAKELKGDTFTISTGGVSKISCSSLNYHKLTSKVSGASSLNLKFKGETADVDNSGASKYVMDVDCMNLKVRNSGAGTMKISGTADKTDIQSSGVSKIDISELNKY